MTAAKPNSAPPANPFRNLIIVLVATMLTVAVFLGVRNQTSTVTLSSLAERSTPWEVAQQNQKPTLLEFYANWCGVCQSMAADVGKLEQAYGDKVNFVMLNVDNTKWMPEILKYRVDGIPHFIYFDGAGAVSGMSVGQQPVQLMSANLESLVTQQPLRQQSLARQESGPTSVFSIPVKPNTDDPRSHGGLPSASAKQDALKG
jgi:thiol-disulfide isomerase/thioredoxin